MAKKNQEGYQRLVVVSDWTTRIELGGQPLDFEKYYDIKLPSGQTYEGCRVHSSTHHTRGMGGMSESSTEIIPFFDAAGLEAKLKSGYLMRINPEVTAQELKKKLAKERQEKLQELSQKRNELHKQISKLKKRK